MSSKPWKSGDHLVICDQCGAQRYRTECKYTWDGYLMCVINDCWYPKEPIFMVPPVLNDPYPLTDVRPDQTSGTETYVSDDNLTGLITTFGNTGRSFGSSGKNFGEWDSPPNYAGL